LSGLLPPLKPLPIKERMSVVFIERGEIDMLDGAFVVVDATGIRTHIPVGGVACIMLEPGTRVSHRAAALAARVGTLLVWVGEAGVRLYSSGQPGGARADRLLYQATPGAGRGAAAEGGAQDVRHALRRGATVAAQRRAAARHRRRARAPQLPAAGAAVRREMERAATTTPTAGTRPTWPTAACRPPPPACTA
jgi:hypothetical protein